MTARTAGSALRRTIHFVLVLSLLSSLTTPVLSQPLGLEELNPEQLREFNRERLAVEIRESASFFVYRGSGGGGTFRAVRYFHGFDGVWEHTLFEIAGYDREAENARKHRRTNMVLLTAGWTAIGVGVIGLIGMISMSGEPWPKYNDPNYTAIVEDRKSVSARLNRWAAISLAGSLSGLVPAIIVLVRGEQRYSPDQAAAAADGYNRSLIERIRTR